MQQSFSLSLDKRVDFPEEINPSTHTKKGPFWERRPMLSAPAGDRLASRLTLISVDTESRVELFSRECRRSLPAASRVGEETEL